MLRTEQCNPVLLVTSHIIGVFITMDFVEKLEVFVVREFAGMVTLVGQPTFRATFFGFDCIVISAHQLIAVDFTMNGTRF